MIENGRSRKSERACDRARSVGRSGRLLRQVKNAGHSGGTSDRAGPLAAANNLAAPEDMKSAAREIGLNTVSSATEVSGEESMPPSAAGPALAKKAALRNGASFAAEKGLDRDSSGEAPIDKSRDAENAAPASFAAKIAGKAGQQGRAARGHHKASAANFQAAVSADRVESVAHRAVAGVAPTGPAIRGATEIHADRGGRAESFVRKQVRLSLSG